MATKGRHRLDQPNQAYNVTATSTWITRGVPQFDNRVLFVPKIDSYPDAKFALAKTHLSIQALSDSKDRTDKPDA
jgi:hypothetical protein